MIDQNPKLSKSDTKLLLQHATVHDQAQNVARYIKVAPARISEGKKGEWQLPKESAEMLYQRYGRPRAEAGIYLNGEVWTSLQEIMETSEQIFLARQWQHAKAALQSEQTTEILKKCLLLKEKPGYYISLSAAEVSTLFERLFKLLSDSRFKQWYRDNRRMEEDRAKIRRRVSTYAHDGLFFGPREAPSVAEGNAQSLLFEYDLYFPSIRPELKEMDVWIFLLFMCELSVHSEGRLLLGPDGLDLDLAGVVSEEIFEKKRQIECVVIGEKVWQRESWLIQDFTHKDPVFFKDLGDIADKYVSSTSGCEEIMAVYPARFNYVDLTLVMNKELEYHLIVELRWLASFDMDFDLTDRTSSWALNGRDFYCIEKRIFVIQSIPGDAIVETITKLSEWLSVKDINIASLKSEIASNGGFVAGARYI